jgi:hypothetical protein
MKRCQKMFFSYNNNFYIDFMRVLYKKIIKLKIPRFILEGKNYNL